MLITNYDLHLINHIKERLHNPYQPLSNPFNIPAKQDLIPIKVKITEKIVTVTQDTPLFDITKQIAFNNNKEPSSEYNNYNIIRKECNINIIK